MDQGVHRPGRQLGAELDEVRQKYGDKRRTLQFRGAGIIAPTHFFFTRDRRVIVSPGCYTFDATGV